jgi:hypothetical protein
MPWRVHREGTSLHVTIACPVDDWPALVDDIERRLKKEDGIVLIEMPERLPGASPVEADLLVVLRKVLDRKPGINVRSPGPPDGRRSDAETV